ncbi:efflux transporter periplasmic adaptor subunit [Pseudomonas orientalis]|jgi:multidrug efflux system membrane fusion protein|uniref:Efflux transporter periplasmic adaptor subunit n=2 Tax=Pseudomonas orientalis TaxID=76758 RepID=A0A2L0RXJ4_9PSED|nr:efflux transporter periplasmic adaptor subunit [Pseudomonas orientalis]
MSFRSRRPCPLWIGLFMFALTGCHPEGQVADDVPIPQVSVMPLEPASIKVSEVLPGRVSAVRTADIRAQISGIVHKRLFDQGVEVTAGTALFQINPAPFKAEVDSAAALVLKAQAALKRARIQAERLSPLMHAEAVSRQVYDDAISLRDQAEADVAQSKATLARRRLDLRFATVDAPIAGRIDQTLVSEGALVSSTDSAPMARIQQIDQVYVDVRQTASTLRSLRESLSAQDGQRAPGLPVEILDSSGNPTGLNGSILFSGINVDAGTGDVLLRILVDNPHRQLLPGLFVQARVPLADYPQALSVPQQAVLRSGGQARVWVIDAKEQAHAVAIELGELVDRRYRVVSGLSAGQLVVIEGLERLTENAQVSAASWQANAAALPLNATAR